METMKTRKNKFLVILIVFMMLFSNFGYTIAAIATSDEFEVITKGLFQKDEVKFDAYFEDENGNKTTEITENVKEKVKLVVEVLPQVEGYLKTGTIKAVSSNDDNINFKFTSVTENLLSDRNYQAALKDVLVNDTEQNEEEPNQPEEPTVPEEQPSINDVLVQEPEENVVDIDSTNTIAQNTVDTNEVVGTDNTSAFQSVLSNDDQSNPFASALETQGTSVNETDTNTVVEETNTASSNPFLGVLETNSTVEDTKATEPITPSVEEPTENPVQEPAGEQVVSEDTLVNEEEIIKEKTEESRINEEIRNAILDIKLMSENEISLNNIIDDTKIEIEIEYNQGETFNVQDLLKDIKLQMSGTYINRNLEEVKVGKEEEITIGWEYTKDISLESEFTKFSPFELQEIHGTIVENKITVTRDIQDEKYLPVKSTRLEIVVPEVNRKKPIAVDVLASKLLATKGEDSGYVTFNSENWNYDDVNGLINVFVENDQNAYSSGTDEYVIIYRYEDYISSENSNLSKNVKATVTEYSGTENNTIIKEIKDSQEIKVDVGELVTYSVGTNEDILNKGRIYANYNSENALYETTFTNQVNVNVLTSDVLQQLKLDCSKDVYKDANGVELPAQGIEYKEIKFNFSEISSILSEGGEIVITNTANETLYILNKDAVTKEEDCTIWLNGANGIYVYVNNISRNGAINFEVTKAIKKCNYDKSIFKGITQIESRISGEVKYLNIEDRLALQTIAIAKSFEESKTEATLAISRTSLSTVSSNDNVELKIELNNDKETSDLYVNPSFEVVFPKYVKSVAIESINLLNDCGLRVSDFETYTESDLVKLRIELSGTQTTFSENSITNGTNIIINANIEVDNYAPAREDQVKLYYCNEGVATYQAQTKWSLNKKAIPNGILKTTNGFDVEVIKYQAPTGLLAINGMVNYDGNLSEVRSVKQGEVAKEIPVNSPSRIATMELLALNNTENTCSDVILLGRIPFKGNKDIISEEDLGTTTTTRMVDKIKEDVQNVNTVEIYYSANENANKDLKNESNGWVTEVEDLSTVRSYMIIVKGDIEAGSVLRYTYDFEIPENLPYESKITGAFAAYYNNQKEEAVVYESSSADKVVLTTGIGPKIEAKLNVDVGDGADVLEGRFLNYTVEVTNTGSVPAQGVIINVPKPVYGDFYQYKLTGDSGEGDAASYYYVAKTEKTIGFESIAPGESKQETFMIRANELPKDNLSEEGYYIETKADISVQNLGIGTETNVIKNKIKKANFYINASADFAMVLNVGYKFPYMYNITNISGRDLENIEILCKIPEEFAYENTTLNDELNGEINFDENSKIVSIKIPYLKKEEKINLNIFVKVESGSDKQITSKCIIKCDGIEESVQDIYSVVNAARIQVEDISENQIANILEGEYIEYKIRISNIGEAKADTVNAKIKLSENLTNLEVKYEGSKRGSARVVDNSADVILTDLYVGNFVDLIISGNAKGYTGENQEIINNVVIKLVDKEIANINTDSVTIIENIHKAAEKPRVDIANEPITPNNNVTNNSDDTSNSVSDSNNSNSAISNVLTYSISGNVWVDLNRDGQKNDEQEIPLIEAQLYKDKNMVQSTKTNSKGIYNFTSVEQGTYTVVFLYDNQKYTTTIYNKENIDERLVSKAIETEAGKAVSNEIVVSNKNISNINCGLQLKNQFNLIIKKLVTKAVVKEDSKIVEYKFNDLDLAKLEIAAKKLNKSVVDLEYKIIIENNGNVEGYATMINDYIPEGMTFDAKKNNGWYIGNNRMLYNETLKDTIIKVGESKELSLVLTKQMNSDNTGTVSNKVLLATTLNSNGLEENSQDNVSTQEVLILIKTGYTISIITMIIIVAITIILIMNKEKLIIIKDKNYRNENKSINKNIFKRKYK